jgi:hypothetical protein
VNDNSQPYTPAEIRRLLTTAFDDVGLISLCQDEFPQLCDRLGRGLRKDEIINVIMDHFRRCGDYAPLLAAVREREPKPYDRFEPSLPVMPEVPRGWQQREKDLTDHIACILRVHINNRE